MHKRVIPALVLCAALLGAATPLAWAAPAASGAADEHVSTASTPSDNADADHPGSDAAGPADAQIADITVLGADHEPIDIKGAWLHDKTLAVVSPGLSVSCTVDEELREQMDEIHLVVDKVEIPVQEPQHPQEPAPNHFVFDFDATTCRTDVVDLSRVTVRVRDAKGKEVTSAPLSELSLFKDASIERIRFVRTDEEDALPAAWVLLGGKPAGADAEGVVYTNAASVEVGARIADPLFEALRDAAWFEQHPISAVLDGAAQTLDPATLTGSGRGSRRRFESAVLATWDAEGRHTASVSYTGASLAAEQQKPMQLEASDSVSVVIDRTAPAAASVRVKGSYDADSEVAQIPGQDGKPAYDVLFGGKRTLTLSLADAPAAEGIEASGVAGYTLTLVRHDKIDGTGASVTETLTERDYAIGNNGTVEIPLEDAGTYILGEATLTVRDRAGNTSASISLASIAGDVTFDRIAVENADAPAPNQGFGIEIGPKGSAGNDRYYQDDQVQVTLWGGGWRFGLFKMTPAFRRAVQARYVSWKGEEILASKDVQPTFVMNDATGRYEAVLTLPLDPDGGVRDGLYEVSFRGSNLSSSVSREFMVDTTAPAVTDAYMDARPDPARDVAALDGRGRLAVGGARTLHLRVQDLQPRGEGDAPADVQGSQEDNTAGLDERALTAYVERLLDLAGLHAPTMQRALTVDEHGWVSIPLTDEGVYNLADLQLVLPDNAGNGRGDRLRASDVATWGVDGILVDTDDALPSVQLSVVDAPGTPSSKDAAYHRGAVHVTASIEDRWFEARRALPTSDGLLSINTLQRPGELAGSALPALALADFTHLPDSDTWSARYELPRTHELAHALPLEGMYRLELGYRALSGTVCPASPVEFGIDYTGPSFGELALSVSEPYEWGWVFAPESEHITLAVSDNLSGVEPASAALSVAGTATPELSYEPADEANNGQFRLALTGDAQRLVFEGTRLGVEDRAGNVVDSGSLALRAGTDLPKDALGVCIDASAPELSIAYDNNDAANGMYYKAPRTATVTLVDPSFDLIRASDPHREVVQVERNGSATSVVAEDFENPSGDGATWIATVACDSDADWALSASIEDMTGRLAQVAREDFVVDTAAPRIMVEFDNNDVANGMYYKAPRTATVTVDERNFDAAQSGVTAWAKDASGAAVGAPAASAWCERESRAVQDAVISFTDELHYGFTVQATDLAGNAAEVFEEPEFVIDLTAPALAISGVEHHAAYADAVQPSISYADVNFDPLFATYELVGASQGNVYAPAGEKELPGQKTVHYEDFEHVLERDDVYTLTARVDDLAGNSAEQAVTFSVNRFGSTYYFANPGSDVAGKFLAAPQGVDIVEVNVSGLDTGRTHAELVHDSRTQALKAGADYELVNGSTGGWSATTYRFGQQLFDEDGFYRILLTSRDRAGNLSQNTMDGKNATRDGAFEVKFAVDTTSPVAGLAGIGSRGVYLDPHKQVHVDAHDNVELASVALTVDGRDVQAWDAADLVNGAPTWQLPADAEPHTYELAVTDRAGNTAYARYEDVVVTGDWISFILNTPRLLFGTVGGVILAAGAVVGVSWALWRRARRIRELRERLNS